MRVKVGDEIISNRIKIRIRLDYKGETKPPRFFFGGKTTDKVAQELREQKAALIRNIPVQGINIEDINCSMEIYQVLDELEREEIAFAPMVITLTAENIEDVIRFIMREEFRKIEIIEPDNIVFSRQDLERFLAKVNEEMDTNKQLWEKKVNTR
jgi:5-methylcytosine-specific restriction endonuclease McrBC GTP-binding regulatory subunit McrB